PQRRYMERVTIKGGPVTGLERADPASIRRAKYVAPKGVDIHGGHKPHCDGASMRLVAAVDIDALRRDVFRPPDARRIGALEAGDRTALDGDALHVAALR